VTSPCLRPANRRNRRPRWFTVAVGLALITVSAAASKEALRDAPVIWFDDDQRTIAEPAERDPSLLWDGINETFVLPVGRFLRPSRLVGKLSVPFGGDHVAPAANVNALDEVPNSSWFTNRIGLFPMSVDEVARGPGDDVRGPDRSAPWTVIRAKTQGVTPGFNVKDARGDVYVIKFDPPDYPGLASAAGVISGRLLHAAGYNVPEDDIVTFTRDQLVLGDGVKITLPDGSKRPMTEADLDGILARATSKDGAWRAISSKFLSGKPVGPFNYYGRRKDDPNDRIEHQHRRELRGFYTFASWIGHFDTKQHNSLDVFVEENGRSFVKHHLIDFTATLGTGAQGPSHRWGYEHTIDLFPIMGRIGALGAHEDAWRRLEEHPEGNSEIGTFGSRHYDPREHRPLEPNTAFSNATTRDQYWAAKIISAFTDDHLLAACREARYDDERATAYMARTLAERRDRLVRTWFDKTPPLEYFAFDGQTLRFTDLGAARGFYDGATTRYRVRMASVRSDRSGTAWSPWVETATTEVGISDLNGGEGNREARSHPFLAFECQLDRGSGWSSSVTAFVSRDSRRTVAVER
jgi:hypothetical protein